MTSGPSPDRSPATAVPVLEVTGSIPASSPRSWVPAPHRNLPRSASGCPPQELLQRPPRRAAASRRARIGLVGPALDPPGWPGPATGTRSHSPSSCLAWVGAGVETARSNDLGSWWRNREHLAQRRSRRRLAGACGCVSSLPLPGFSWAAGRRRGTATVPARLPAACWNARAGASASCSIGSTLGVGGRPRSANARAVGALVLTWKPRSRSLLPCGSPQILEFDGAAGRPRPACQWLVGRVDRARLAYPRHRPPIGCFPARHAERRLLVCAAGCTRGVDPRGLRRLTSPA
jgi:hypothetical protein